MERKLRFQRPADNRAHSVEAAGLQKESTGDRCFDPSYRGANQCAYNYQTKT